MRTTLPLTLCLLILCCGCDSNSQARAGGDAGVETIVIPSPPAGEPMAGAELWGGVGPEAGLWEPGGAESSGGIGGGAGAEGGSGGEALGGSSSLEGDRDQDGVPNEVDNCPDVFNPSQADLDSDFIGDACAEDSDGDTIPDTWDPAPNDASWPGRSRPDTVYAQTASKLYALDVKSVRLYEVAPFTFDTEGNHQITDIAIDRAGVLWAITYNTLWLCHPQTGECRRQGTLPTSNCNGLTFLPGSLFSEMRDVLVGIEISGTWRRLTLNNGVVEGEYLGAYPSERSSGDVFSIEGVGTFAAVKRDGVSSDILVSVNPTRPDDIQDVVTLTGYSSVYGLAGWRGMLFAFDESGAVLKIDLETNEVTVVEDQGVSWWGAGVSSVLRSEE